ncbi:MAG: hypothetical protein ACI4V7_00465 [Succinivibrionaceae bacterium]
MTLPITLKKFQNYQEAYYQKLSSNPMFNQIKSPIEDFIKQIVAEGSFYTRVSIKNLKSIIHDGYIKNVMETNTSASMGGQKVRVESTELLFGCDRNDLKPIDYPKFGYLSTNDSSKNAIVTYDMTYQYGQAIIKLKKENLFNRTTLTIGSSLDAGSSHYLIPTLVNNVKATCIFGLQHGHLKSPFACPPQMLYFMFFQSLKSNQLNTTNYYSIDEILGDKCPLFKYIELQFHGSVTLDDFEEIGIFDDGEYDQKMVEEISEKLKSTTIPLNFYGLNI